MPGPVDAPGSAGCNAALRAAWAAPVLAPVDVIEQLGGVGCPAAVRAEGVGSGRQAAGSASPEGQAVLARLPADGSGTDVDSLAAAAGMGVGPCLVEITKLELQGLVVRTPGLVHRR